MGQKIDMGEEWVCSSCGVVWSKEPLEMTQGRSPPPVDPVNHSLGSVPGPVRRSQGGISPLFPSGHRTSFAYLKSISESAQKRKFGAYACAKLIHRVCEKLGLPRDVSLEADRFARRLLHLRRERSEFTLAAISAFSINAACRVRGLTNVGTREVVRAHLNLGYRVSLSNMINLTIESPVKALGRRAEDYLGVVAARLPGTMKQRRLQSPSYYHRLLKLAGAVLRDVDVPSRGGHNPRGLAASAFYTVEVLLARSEGRHKLFSQREVALCVTVAEYTVREQYLEIFKPRLIRLSRLILEPETPAAGPPAPGPATGPTAADHVSTIGPVH